MKAILIDKSRKCKSISVKMSSSDEVVYKRKQFNKLFSCIWKMNCHLIFFDSPKSSKGSIQIGSVLCMTPVVVVSTKGPLEVTEFETSILKIFRYGKIKYHYQSDTKEKEAYTGASDDSETSR